MRFIKLGLISVVVIFIILTAMAALLPSQVLVSRAVDIRTSDSALAAQVFDLSQWQHWMTDARGEKVQHQPAESGDALMIAGTTITVIQRTDSLLVTSWQNGREMIGSFRLIRHAHSNQVHTLQWQMEQAVRWYPWEKFAAITKDQIWGGSMEKSLDNLRELLERGQ